MSNENSNSGVWRGTMIVIGIALITLVGYLAYDNYQEKKQRDALNVEEVDFNSKPTVEMAMQEWKECVENARRYDVYLTLPAPIVQAIFEKIGTDASVMTIVKEYEMNEKAYINAYLSQSANITIDKNTAGKIDNVEVSATLKAPEPNTTTIKVNPVKEDSVTTIR